MQDKLAERLFNYLKDVLYRPQKAELDMSAIPEDWQRFAQGLTFLGECLKEQAEFGVALSKGNLQQKPPSVENVVAAPLKAIHGTLMHLTWQTQQVAKGDYKQRVDYMGEFSHAFNIMVEQLEARRTALLEEQAVIKQRNTELEQTQKLLMSLVLDDARWLEILDAETGELLFESQSASKAASEKPEVAEIIRAALRACPCSAENTPLTWECSAPRKIIDVEQSRYYNINSHAIPWQGKSAVAHTVTDVTERRRNEIALEHMAFSDPLTGAYNRRFGMNYMEDLAAGQECFAVAFIDIDYLKYCNDEFGHEEGDKYIVSVSDGLKKLDTEPLVCRVGGDEFMLVQRFADEKSMENALSALRAEFVGQRGLYRKSFSYGISTYDGTIPLSEVMAAADKRMYEFKFQHKAQRSSLSSNATS